MMIKKKYIELAITNRSI